MRTSTKATLLSAFVFPGIGHVYLKKYVAGAALIGGASVAAYYLTSRTLEIARQIVEKLETSAAGIDIAAITELVSKHSAGTEGLLLNVATAAFMACWLVGIIDAYRIGRLRDRDNEQGKLQ